MLFPLSAVSFPLNPQPQASGLLLREVETLLTHHRCVTLGVGSDGLQTPCSLLPLRAPQNDHKRRSSGILRQFACADQR